MSFYIVQMEPFIVQTTPEIVRDSTEKIITSNATMIVLFKVLINISGVNYNMFETN